MARAFTPPVAPVRPGSLFFFRPYARCVPRRRLAVALIVPPPVSTEIDGLRRALGDRQLGRIEPHVTLIPPINVREEDMADALAVVDAAAAAADGPIELTLGPVTSFGPSSPVRFLAVDPWERVTALHDACLDGVLHRPEKRPFHPHVTVDIDGSPTDGDDPAIELLAGYRATVVIDRVTVLEHVEHPGEDPPRRWDPYLSYRL